MIGRNREGRRQRRENEERRKGIEREGKLKKKREKV